MEQCLKISKKLVKSSTHPSKGKSYTKILMFLLQYADVSLIL